MDRGERRSSQASTEPVASLGQGRGIKFVVYLAFGNAERLEQLAELADGG
jgi:hypothetical protein